MEIFTKPSYSVGVSCKVQPSAPDAQAKSDRYLNRTKFVIAACFLEATMIEQADSGVTFEVSTSPMKDPGPDITPHLELEYEI